MPELLGRQRPDAEAGPDADGHGIGLLEAASLVRRLRAMWCRLDPVPVDLPLRSELALFSALDEVELLSSWRDAVLAGARTDDVVRTLTFTGSTATVTVTLARAVDGSFRVDGWLVPGEVREIALCAQGTVAAVVARTTSDTDGRFVVHDVPPGPVAVLLTRAGARRPAVLTPTLVLA